MAALDRRQMAPREFWREVAKEHRVASHAIESAWLNYEQARQQGVTTNGNQSVFARSIVQTFANLGTFKSDVIAEAIAERHNMTVFRVAGAEVANSFVERIGRDKFKAMLAVPVLDRSGEYQLVIACADPGVDGFHNFRHMILTAQTGRKVDWRVGRLEEITAAIDGHTVALPSADSANPSGVVVTSATDEVTFDMIEKDLLAYFRERASDVHYECIENGMKVRIRVDGQMREVKRLPAWESYIAQVRLASGRGAAGVERDNHGGPSRMDSGQYTLSQDAVTHRNFDGRRVVLRFSGSPSSWGYNVVVRFIDQSTILGTRLDDLGYRISIAEMLRAAVAKKTSLTAFLGTTGSGKSTSFYCALRTLPLEEMKVITIEDPREVEFPDGLDQRQVTHDMPFPKWMRFVLRQNPDVIAPGEVRDREVFQLCLEAVQSGHTVVTTVHTNTPFDMVHRFLTWGAEPGSFAEYINVGCAQRLSPRLCEHCRTPSPRHEELAALYQRLMESHPGDMQALLLRAGLPKIQFFERNHKGCSHCRGTGFKGRIVFSEAHLFDDDDRRMILTEGTGYSISTARQKARMRSDTPLVTMREDAIMKAAVGFASMSSVEANTSPDPLIPGR